MSLYICLCQDAEEAFKKSTLELKTELASLKAQIEADKLVQQHPNNSAAAEKYKSRYLLLSSIIFTSTSSIISVLQERRLVVGC